MSDDTEKKEDTTTAKTSAPKSTGPSAKDIMVTLYPVASLNETLSEAYELMIENNVDSLPLLKDGLVIRMISKNDIEIIRSPFFDAPGQEERIARLMSLTLDKVNQEQKLLTVSPDTSVPETIKILTENHINSIPVVNEKSEFLGMITVHKALNYFLSH